MNEPVREYGLQVLRLPKELKQAEAMVKARPRVARPVTGPHARGLPSSPEERAAEMIRMRLLTSILGRRAVEPASFVSGYLHWSRACVAVGQH